MSNREYPGYPEVVVIALPKCGTKTLNKCFTSLGYKVFDVQQFPAYAVPFNDYGTNKITFAEMAAKVWEENKYDVIIEPAGIYWHEMAEHWPKTKFINIVRDVESWKASLKGFIGQLYEMPDDLLLDQVLANNKSISPTAHFAFDVSFRHYCRYIVGVQPFYDKGVKWSEEEPWDRLMNRRYRMFQADVQVHAPKDRTLMNYSVKEGWPRLREFLNLPNNGDEFPHENKNANTVDFVSELWTDTAAEYDKKVEEEVCAWMRNNGYECKKIQPNKE